MTRLLKFLPQGGTLPPGEWELRHRTLVRLAWAIAAALVPYSLSRDYGLAHIGLHVAPIVGLAAVAGVAGISRRLRSAAAALSLLTGAAMMVHSSGGLIEAHFAFFVLIVALTLYEDWLPFLVTVVFVLLHHGGIGMVSPQEVYSGTSLSGEPWKWAAVHAAFVAAAGTAGVMAWRFNEKIRDELRQVAAEREVLIGRLEDLARLDPLTGLLNRRAWQERLIEEVRRASRTEGPLTVALLDLDGLKAVNDSGGGHQAGDRLLRAAAAGWQGVLRETDCLGRLGGDEFAIILPDCSFDDALGVASRMRDSMPDGQTFSVGLARWSGLEAVSELLRRADEALYEAKATGRDRVVVA